MAKNNSKKRILKGKVVSDKMGKTIVVAIDSFKTHSKYHKKFRATKRYKVHDEDNKHKSGDVVEFIQCRPISKDKKYKVV